MEDLFNDIFIYNKILNMWGGLNSIKGNVKNIDEEPPSVYVKGFGFLDGRTPQFIEDFEYLEDHL